jgi:hypothetical protein
MTTVTVSGVLVNGDNHIGGVGTGWELQADGLGNVEVDVEQVMAQALKFKHQLVTITGYYTTREYIERGSIKVFAAEQICLASGRKKSKRGD